MNIMTAATTPTKLAALGLGVLTIMTTGPSVAMAGFGTKDDYVTVATDATEVWELAKNDYTGVIFTVGKNDGDSFNDDGNYVQIEYQQVDWDNRAGTLSYLGRDELDDRWLLCDTYFQNNANPFYCNGFSLYTGFAFEPKQDNSYTGTVQWRYRVKYTTYCFLACYKWSDWADVYITVQPSTPPIPIDDDLTVTRSEYLSYRQGYHVPRIWPIDNDQCTYSKSNEPCPSVEMSLGTIDENDGDAVTYLVTDAGGRVYLYSSSNYVASGPYYINYFPPTDTDFAGTDCFSYYITEADVIAEVDASICITVEGTEPIASDDEASTLTGQAVIIDIFSNDEYHDINELLISFSSLLDGETVVNNGDGTITYTPSESLQTGSRVFYYTIADDWGTSTGTVTVTIDYYFYRTANNDIITLSPGSTVVIDVSENDYNPIEDKFNYWSEENGTNWWHCLKSKSFDGMVLTAVARDADDEEKTGTLCKIYYEYTDYKDSRGTIEIVISD